ncbi:hypothetical protein Pmani_032691 [Petrolisthes manimaculis]|uniref:Uncharacterized protein n=1 Tax=Petrolisthes manimaculis TaxID=1843537 RepID=A0AAE1NT38_9EUCA|nr:hypothetical protein Pmani_032691 [Petrolisthes manimaculis]
MLMKLNILLLVCMMMVVVGKSEKETVVELSHRDGGGSKNSKAAFTASTKESILPTSSHFLSQYISKCVATCIVQHFAYIQYFRDF